MNFDDVLEQNFVQLSEEYREFAKEKDGCRQCSLYDNYKQIIQSEGNADNPTFMFVGEGPGKDEVGQKRPFIGLAGQRLRQELRKYATFTKGNTLISNVIPCRPKDNCFPTGSSGYQVLNKPLPARDLVRHCMSKWLHQEIEILQPKVIVTLGSQALYYLRKDSGVSKFRGAWKFLFDYKTWSFATYHPSYVLRCTRDDKKDYVVHQFESDIRKIADSWYITVSDNQHCDEKVMALDAEI